jgi:hypothetical protein
MAVMIYGKYIEWHSAPPNFQCPVHSFPLSSVRFNSWDSSPSGKLSNPSTTRNILSTLENSFNYLKASKVFFLKAPSYAYTHVGMDRYSRSQRREKFGNMLSRCFHAICNTAVSVFVVFGWLSGEKFKV